jgi:uncharacterized membrane protein YkvA (DUF1232 family)
MKRLANVLIAEALVIWVIATPCATDLIPDFVSVIGCLDDLVRLAVGIYIAIQNSFRPLLVDCRERGVEREESLPRNWPQFYFVDRRRQRCSDLCWGVIR